MMDHDIPAFVYDVHLNGLKRSNTQYVRIPVKEIFNSSSLKEIILNSEELRRKLFELGCFKNINVTIDASEKASVKNAYDITYDVEESSWISGGVSTNVGNNEGSINTNISFPNLFGKGEKLSAEYSYGTRHNSDYRFMFQTPINMDPKKRFSLLAFRTMNEYPWSKYKQNDMGLILNISKPFSFDVFKNYMTAGRHEFAYEATWRNLLCSNDATFEIREQNGDSLKSSLKYTCTVDMRTNKLLPTDGGYLKTSAEFAGMGGNVNFFKATKDYEYNKTLFKYFTTSFSFSTGIIIPLNENKTVSIIDRFFLGGPLNLRGFTSRGAGPHKDDCSLGNDSHWLLSAHLYTPLPFFHKNEELSSWFKTHSFVNIGNIFSLNQLRSLENNRLDYLISDARLSVGSGIVIRFGNAARLELNYVWPLWKRHGDKVVNGLQFGVGIMFN